MVFPVSILGPRQQRNTNTHLLDGSPIYGSTSLRMRTLRTGTNGKQTHASFIETCYKDIKR